MGFGREDFVRFEDIPSFFYDNNLNEFEWERRLIEYLSKSLKSEGHKGSLEPEDVFVKRNVFGREFLDSFEDMSNKIEEDYKWFTEKIEERKYDSNRINFDFNFRQFLYDRGVSIPTSEMERQFYLKERMSSDERRNLVSLLEGFSTFMTLKRNFIPYALFAVGTSTYSEQYFKELKQKLLEEGFDLNSEVIEEAYPISEQGFYFENYEDYVEHCFNISPAYDEKYRPVSKKEFYNRKKVEQKRYTKKKILGEILKNKGEDLDFAICLEESYGENYPPLPHENYHYKKFEGGKISRDIDLLKRGFVSFLKEEGINFKEEIEMLSGADYRKSPDGKIIRHKDILENNWGVSTYRIFLETGREMHFYFYNQMADMKVKQERIFNFPFVQLCRSFGLGREFEYYGFKDLKSAVENGEKTGVFENPLPLNFLKGI